MTEIRLRVLLTANRAIRALTMFAKCANPSCSRRFQELSRGRLFVLPPFNNHGVRLSDYCYWLCPECAVEYSINQYESEVLITVRGHSSPNSACATPLAGIDVADCEEELSNMAEKFTVPFADPDPLVLERSACHYRFDSSQGEKLRNDLIAHLRSHASSEKDAQDSAVKSQGGYAARTPRLA
jgi:hypothetical protein